MFYEDATLQNYFPQALVREWSMGELIVEKVGKLLENWENLCHRRPTIIDWIFMQICSR